MSPAKILPAPPTQPSPTDRKIRHAAQEFEGVLLNTLLSSLEKTFATLPGTKLETGADQYQSLGAQSLASGLAARGGIGIADLIARSLQSKTPHKP
jgi:Rod binding domain-containing protein